MLEPQARLKGELLKLVIGTVHYRLDTTSVSDPSQSTNSVVKVTSSLSSIVMMYYVIDEPRLSGRSQLIKTFVELIVVVGAVG